MVLQVALVAVTVVVFHAPFAASGDSVEMISNYAKVANQADLSTTEPPPDNATDTPPDYEDFDDLQEEDRSLKQSPGTDTMMKYFNGIVSLLALMYRFNGKPNPKPAKVYRNPNEPRKQEAIGKRILQAQDRFEFPQKKFRYHGIGESNSIDQQFQPLENYPPYNPLEANAAETYSTVDQKTSYDSDSMQYDSGKNSNVEIQQSYSYEIPYEASKPVDMGHDDWKNQIYPVYQPWKNSQKDKPSTGDSYQPWTSGKEESGSWNTKPSMDVKPSTYWKGPAEEADSESRQPWKGSTIPVYHPPEDDHHHFEYHEVEPADEDRVSKKPYSYYFLGRKLWYVPLLFSVYFIIYVGALVLKSVARHKIQFPEKVWNLHEDHYGHNKHRRQHRKIDEITENYENAIEKSSNKFM